MTGPAVIDHECDPTVAGCASAVSSAAGRAVLVLVRHALFAETLVMALGFHGIQASWFPRVDGLDLSHVLLRSPDLVILDLAEGEGAAPTLATLRALTAAQVRVIVVAAEPTLATLHRRCLELGARAIVGTASSLDELLEQVQRALRSTLSHSPSGMGPFASSPEPASAVLERLTSREREILRALIRGQAAGRIAHDLGVSLLTARTHIRSILRKMNVHSQLEAVSVATRENWGS